MIELGRLDLSEPEEQSLPDKPASQQDPPIQAIQAEPKENHMSETETTKTARELRHEIQVRGIKMVHLLAGKQMSKDEQVARVAKVVRLQGQILTLTTELATLVSERDFAARQAEKQAEKEKVNEQFMALVVSFGDGDDEDGDEEDNEDNGPLPL